MTRKRGFSLFEQNIYYKLKIAFYLMSILPILVTVYLVSNYVLPKVGLAPEVNLVVAISILISSIGFFVIRQIFMRMASITNEAKLIASGDINHTIHSDSVDEIDELGQSLNVLTDRIRNNMEELKDYGQRTKEINEEIQKHVIVFSGLLQISSLISQDAKIEEVVKLAAEKARILVNSDISYLFLWDDAHKVFRVSAADGLNSEYLLKAKIEAQIELFAKDGKLSRPLFMDKKDALLEKLNSCFYGDFKLGNSLIIPVNLKGRLVAVLGIGNTSEEMVRKQGNVELIDIFAKQIAIAIDNDLLSRRIETLEIKDPLTGLYNEGFMHSRLQEEIKRAIIYQRPCSLIIFDIDDFEGYRKKFGLLNSEAMLKKVGTLIRNLVTEIDRVGRVSDNEFSIILPEKNKRQAIDMAESIRKDVQYAFSEEPDHEKRISVSGGVSENPLDGVDAEELFIKARELVGVSKKQGKNRIAGAKEKPTCQ